MAAKGGPVFDGERRRELASAFQEGGEHYDRVRPSYPADSLAWLLAGSPREPRDVLDIGAGTGKYTELMVQHGWNLWATDPSADMLAQLKAKLPAVETFLGKAEHLALPDASIDLVVVAQAWHWFDPVQASSEIARVLRPGGTLGLIWNQLDVTIPWVHRLARIMHAGDVHKPDFRPHVGTEFQGLSCHETRWEQSVTPEELLELVKSRSYYLNASEHIRTKVMGNLSWYLYEHLGNTPGATLALPYLTQTWRAHN